MLISVSMPLALVFWGPEFARDTVTPLEALVELADAYETVSIPMPPVKVSLPAVAVKNVMGMIR